MRSLSTSALVHRLSFPPGPFSSIVHAQTGYFHAQALGFKQGNFHMEAWYTKTGPVLIECNPRVGGGSISDLHHKVR